nr:unnamed protein product [Callosobruchus chinensis]
MIFTLAGLTSNICGWNNGRTVVEGLVGIVVRVVLWVVIVVAGVVVSAGVAVEIGVTSTTSSFLWDLIPLRISSKVPMVRFSKASSGVISSSTLRGLIEVLWWCKSRLLKGLVGKGVVEDELIVLKSLPTCTEFVSSVAWIAEREFRICSIIVVGLSVVSVSLSVFVFFVASFSMADLEDSVVVVVEVEPWFEVNGGGEVKLAAMEFMICSMIDTVFSVVPPFAFGRGFIVVGHRSRKGVVLNAQ